jgi:hypothetical protein
MAPRRGGRKLRAYSREEHQSPGPVDDPKKVSSPTMTLSKSRSVVSRMLSVATVLTLVGFAASVELQPDSALAAPGVSADLSADAAYLADDDNRNNDENRNNNNDENRNNNDENNNENRNRNDHRNHGDNRNHDNENNNDENRNHDNENRNHDNGNNGG